AEDISRLLAQVHARTELRRIRAVALTGAERRLYLGVDLHAGDGIDRDPRAGAAVADREGDRRVELRECPDVAVEYRHARRGRGELRREGQATRRVDA